MVLPANSPRPGFYYHYKHDPSGDETNYAYELVGIGHHTEEDSRPEDALLAIYRPLYESAFVYRNGKLFDVRPLGMFMETVVKEGVEMPRFRRIEDEDLIARLTLVRGRMYP